MKKYNILDVELDMEFGGVLAIIEVDGREILIGEQLKQDGDEVRREEVWDASHDCWKFINGGAIDDGTAKITEICDDEDRAWDIFEAAIDEAVEMANKGLATGILLAYQERR